MKTLNGREDKIEGKRVREIMLNAGRVIKLRENIVEMMQTKGRLI